MKHETQRKLWEEEHAHPTALKQMDSHDASKSVKKFWAFLVDGKLPRARGIEMGCGKGRNVIWLAQQGAVMQGFDFSQTAITEAKLRVANVPGLRFRSRMQLCVGHMSRKLLILVLIVSPPPILSCRKVGSSLLPKCAAF